jgi:hypothetical protein
MRTIGVRSVLQTMPRYQVQFQYPGPYGWPEDVDASQAYFKAEAIVLAALKKLRLEQKHAYGFPDGSMYKYVITDLPQAELEKILKEELTAPNIFVKI